MRDNKGETIADQSDVHKKRETKSSKKAAAYLGEHVYDEYDAQHNNIFIVCAKMRASMMGPSIASLLREKMKGVWAWES